MQQILGHRLFEIFSYEFMKNKRIRHLAVTQDNSIAGVVSVKNLIEK